MLYLPSCNPGAYQSKKAKALLLIVEGGIAQCTQPSENATEAQIPQNFSLNIQMGKALNSKKT